MTGPDAYSQWPPGVALRHCCGVMLSDAEDADPLWHLPRCPRLLAFNVARVRAELDRPCPHCGAERAVTEGTDAHGTYVALHACPNGCLGPWARA